MGLCRRTAVVSGGTLALSLSRCTWPMGLLAFGVLALGVASPTTRVVAQERPVIWSASAPAAPVARGSVVIVHLTARIDGGWHVYSLTQGPGGPVPARITVPAGQPFTLADTVKGPPASKRFDPNFGLTVETYDDRATFEVPVRVAADAPRGATNLAIAARFQTCNATLCLPPHTERVTVPLTISGAAPTRAGL